MQIKYLDCECRDSACVVRFNWLTDEKYGYLSIETQFKGYLPWYKRIWYAIKYIFIGGNYLGWGETLLYKEKVLELKQIIDEYLEENNNENE